MWTIASHYKNNKKFVKELSHVDQSHKPKGAALYIDSLSSCIPLQPTNQPPSQTRILRNAERVAVTNCGLGGRAGCHFSPLAVGRGLTAAAERGDDLWR